MALKPFFTEGGFGVSNSTANTTTTVIYANTDIQTANISVTGTANLGSVSNIIITGGTANYVLKTDGAGNLSWTAQTGGGAGNSISNMPSYIAEGDSFTLSANYQGLFAEPIVVDGSLEIFGNLIDVSGNNYITGNGTLTISNFSTTGNVTGQYILGNGYYLTGITGGGGGSNIANGTSNVNIATSGGNVTTSVNGTSNVIVVSSTGVNITGTLSASGNSNVGNIGTASIVSTGNVTLSGSNISLGTVSNIKITGGTANYVLQTDGTGNLSWAAQTGGTGGDTLSPFLLMGA